MVFEMMRLPPNRNRFTQQFLDIKRKDEIHQRRPPNCLGFDGKPDFESAVKEEEKAEEERRRRERKGLREGGGMTHV